MPPVIAELTRGLRDDSEPCAGGLPQAAVLVALVDAARSPGVILTRRASHLRLHAGEIAFPGGKCDSGDRDHWQTALREAEEEVGLQSPSIERLGIMPALVTRTAIEVTPCVGWVPRPVELSANPAELDAVFTVPLEFVADPAELRFDRYDYGGRERWVPRYDWGDHRIWGITAAVLVKLANLACAAGLAMDDYWEGR
jgi:8-oxo-dGTP pyrophosphatase MutT (NUDIX family)